MTDSWYICNIMKMSQFLSFAIMLAFLPSCGTGRSGSCLFPDSAAISLRSQIEDACSTGDIRYPNSVAPDGGVKYISLDDWRVGFFPGCLWYSYELTGDEFWKNEAVRFTEPLAVDQYLTSHHDIGFIIGSSFLQGYRRTGNSEYVPVIIQAARSLSTRFRPGAGVIQSWDADKGWQAARGWKCPVIIDNMMNLEILFEASALSGDDTFFRLAVSHADNTLRNHFRDDGSCFHVVDYDPSDGKVRSKQTAQGYSDSSAWARGQAWALYGFTMCYRYTGTEAYLEQASKTADFILGHPHLPEDMVPYWDFDAPGIPDEPRDASAAAVIASALFELDGFKPDSGYGKAAERLLGNLESYYLAAPGTNGNFLMMHCVGSIPHGSEIDVPLSYADYYFLEALSRKQQKTIR